MIRARKRIAKLINYRLARDRHKYAYMPCTEYVSPFLVQEALENEKLFRDLKVYFRTYTYYRARGICMAESYLLVFTHGMRSGEPINLWQLDTAFAVAAKIEQAPFFKGELESQVKSADLSIPTVCKFMLESLKEIELFGSKREVAAALAERERVEARLRQLNRKAS
jgi:hypothetical protein